MIWETERRCQALFNSSYYNQPIFKYYLSAGRCGASYHTARLHPNRCCAHRAQAVLTHIAHISLIHSIIGKHVTHVTHKHMRACTVSCPITHQRGFLDRGFSSGWMGVIQARFSHLPPSLSNHLMLLLIIHFIWRPSAWLIRTFLSCPCFWNVWISAAC